MVRLREVIERAIFRMDPDQLRPLASGFAQALSVCVIRQAVVDALWLEPDVVSKFSENDQRQRRHDRLDAIDFFASVIDPASDQDIGIGEAEELLTLDRWCEIGDLDTRVIRSISFQKIASRSPRHRSLLKGAIIRSFDMKVSNNPKEALKTHIMQLKKCLA